MRLDGQLKDLIEDRTNEMERSALDNSAKREIVLASEQELLQMAKQLEQIESLQGGVDIPILQGIFSGSRYGGDADLEHLAPRLTVIKGRYPSQSGDLEKLRERFVASLDSYNQFVASLSDVFIWYEDILSTLEKAVLRAEGAQTSDTTIAYQRLAGTGGGLPAAVPQIFVHIQLPVSGLRLGMVKQLQPDQLLWVEGLGTSLAAVLPSNERQIDETSPMVSVGAAIQRHPLGSLDPTDFKRSPGRRSPIILSDPSFVPDSVDPTITCANDIHRTNIVRRRAPRAPRGPARASGSPHLPQAPVSVDAHPRRLQGFAAVLSSRGPGTAGGDH
ncbi:hypothetical protein BDK51DRAFT_50812 [Blyttiomyces helicus]|uniref:Uncharacterized protein n=1 Tax=Blyttiomyces helicus TaxID=388810 RepID=A0A4P9W0S6_9FUNG|nr:hypothetical protein BDK51DRAFT_50812 [Blyttiomyces helicus]|eukprot:RKO84723.1 hypothetical protein BDK51DRAFT_50812 [Blyttiomyces helicus]